MYATIDCEKCDSLYSISTDSETGKQGNASVLAFPLCPGKISSVISVGKYRFDKQPTPAGKCQHISRQIAVDKRRSVKNQVLCFTEQWKSFIVR